MIETPRTILTPTRSSDTDGIYAILSDPAVRIPYALFSEKYFNKDTVAGFTHIRDTFNDQNKGVMCTIRLKETNDIIGYVGLRETDPEARPGQWELGYFLRADQHGKGIMSEAIPPLINHAHTVHGVKDFFAFVLDDNDGSSIMLEKNAFTVTGHHDAWAPLAIDAKGNVKLDTAAAHSMVILERHI